MGLGYLVAGNYLPDAASLYCPSVGGAMPTDQGDTLAADGSALTFAAKSVGDLKTLGGTDAKSIMYGDWVTWGQNLTYKGTWQGEYGWFYGRVVESDYNYRCMPTCLTGYDMKWYGPPPVGYGIFPTPSVYLAGTSPAQLVDVGCPAFKTQKQLGARAVVSDTFSQLLWGDGTIAVLPGFGQHAHRDGYNVLYGDWHAKWYGDPQQRILWWPQPVPSAGSMDWFLAGFYNLGEASINTWSEPQKFGTGRIVRNSYGSDHVWHLLDNEGGVDVGVNSDAF
jgi:prepilin-type processing-associated H-X9-DG protein